MVDPATMSAGVYTYTVAGASPCISAASTVTVTINAPPDAGGDGGITVCEIDAAFDLFGLLNGAPQGGGSWSFNAAAHPSTFTPGIDAAGMYTYTVNGTAPCPADIALVTVTVNTMPDAGINGGLTLCSSSAATALITGLNGTPAPGGSWTAPGGGASTGIFTPGVNAVGAYTYTVNGIAPCPSVSATVDVSVVTNPNAGTPGNATLCATDASLLLFNELGGTPDAGGAWSGPSAVVGGLYDPTTMNPGVYTYTITVPPPCVNASSTVTITEVAPPNAGTDGAITLCISSPAASLFAALGGGAQAGGTWSGPSPVVGGMFNPATMTAGVYTYTVNGTAPCPNDQSQVTMTVVSEPDPGTAGSITLCFSDAPIGLFAQLGGSPDPGGAWSGPSAVAGDVFDPGTMTAGVYTYTIAVPPPCASVSSTVAVNVNQPPDAGIDGALTLCITSPAVALINSLGGTPDAGGTWIGPSPVMGGIFNPATMSAGAYTYTVNGTAPCPADAATATVNVVTEPDPGGPGFLTICGNGAPDDLFNYLEGSPDQGGLWTTPAGTTFNGLFDPAVMASGVYTYTITVPPPCASVSSTVTVDVVSPPDAGLDGAITLCFSNAPQDLFAILGGTPEPGGTWTSSGGNSSSGTFDPASDASGVFTYTVQGTAPCPADLASVTVAVTQLPNAGTDDILNLCVVGDAVDLSPLLGAADPGGTWTGPSGASSGIFTPGTSAQGNYIYTVNGVAPCPSASAVITVNVLSNADAGIDGASTLCGDNAPIDLYNLLGGSPDAGGSWFAPDGSPTDESFDPTTQAPGSYTYILFVPAPCENDTSAVVMSIVAPVDAGSDGSATLCSDDAPVALFNLLNGSPDAGGEWTAPNGTPSENNFDPAADVPGGYVYTVQATAPCLDQSATVTMAVNPLPDAGTNGAITLCPEAAAIELFSLLGGTPMAGGTWTGPGGQPSNGIFDPATSAQGVYTYTVLGLLPCPNASASSTATVFLIAPPNAGPDAVSCTLEYTLNATGNWASGSWSGPAGIAFSDPGSPTSTVTAIAGGPYTLTWSVLSNDGCATQDEVTIIFTDAIVPLIALTDAICNGICDGTASVSATGGNGAYDYAWSGGIAGNSPSATGICAGDYTVTVLDENECFTVVPFSIDEPAPLVIDTVLATDETCPGACDGSITVVDSEGALFSLNGGAFVSGNVFTGLCPGQYVVLMQDANGCSASGMATITRPAPVVADFDFAPETLFVGSSTADFTNTSTPNAVSFSWDFGGVGSSTATSPTFTFPGGLGDTYMVCLTAYDANGCADTHCEPIDVLDALVVWVPNAVTPNGDGENDTFMPVFNLPQLVKDYEFMIFDRWGLMLSESEQVHHPWGGDYQGEVVQEDVYVWKMKFKNRLTNELIERVGHVTVLK